jgi:hypothetical protein
MAHLADGLRPLFSKDISRLFSLEKESSCHRLSFQQATEGFEMASSLLDTKTALFLSKATDDTGRLGFSQTVKDEIIPQRRNGDFPQPTSWAD